MDRDVLLCIHVYMGVMMCAILVLYILAISFREYVLIYLAYWMASLQRAHLCDLHLLNGLPKLPS